MTLPANIRVNISAPFPARVTAAGMVQITKSNGVWNVSISYEGLQPLPLSSPLSGVIVAVYDATTEAFWQVGLSTLLTGGGTRLSQIGQALKIYDPNGSVLEAIPSPAAQPYNGVWSCIQGGLMFAGDAFYLLIQQVLFGGDSTAMAAFYAFAGLLPINPTS